MSTSNPIASMDTLSPKFNAFTVLSIPYKQVNDTSIYASILIPQALLQAGTGNGSKKHPLSVHWHGGGLITGHRLFPDWWAQWNLDFYLRESAIAISPDYRLMPEATGLGILEDLKDFFAWLASPEGFAAALPKGLKVEVKNVLVTGESAGGYMAIQSAFLAPEWVGALVMQYPMLDLRDKWYTKPYADGKKMFNPPAPQVPASVLENYVQALRGDEVVSACQPPGRAELMLSIFQQGLLARFFGETSSLYPIEVLEGLDQGVALPPMWILHGKQDSVVPVEGTERFVEALRAKFPEAKAWVSLEDGDHGFDGHVGEDGKAVVGLETGWLREGLECLGKSWPA